MVLSQTTLSIADYAQFRSVFDSVEGLRQQYGCVGKYVYVNADNANEITVVLEWSDEANGRAYFDSPELRQAMQEGGVQGPPAIKFLVDRT
jgi:quinol monooxygenase YgiN